MQSFLRDLRYAARTIRRTPGFSLVSAATVAVGIAATTVVFSVITALLLTPLPVASPERLVVVDEVHRGGTHRAMGLTIFSFTRYETYRDASGDIFAALAGHRLDQGSLRIADRAEVASTVAATANYFDVLGLRPALGRFFDPDASRSGRPSAVLSHELWTTRFGADPAAIGRTIHLNSRPHEVIGVAPAGFMGTVVGLPIDVWVPAAPGDGSPLSGEALTLFGRLRDGVSREQAVAAVDGVSRQVPPDRPGTSLVSATVLPMTPIPSFARGATMGFMAMLLVTAGLVLLIGGTNVAGMLLARAAERRREISVRMAIGASRVRLIRQLLAESLVLSLLGGAAGVLLTVWLISALSAFQPPVPTRTAIDIAVDLRVLSFALLVMVVTGVMTGLAPALQTTRGNLLPGLRSGAQMGGTSPSRLRGGFVVVQLALSLLLVITAGLFARTLQKALTADIGFNPDGVVVAGIDPGSHGYDPERTRTLREQLLERVRGLPGVEAAAFAVWAPMGGNEWRTTIHPEGEATEGVSVSLSTVGQGYVEALQVPLVAGRSFGVDDQSGGPAGALVNETLARRLWPNDGPLGRRIRMGAAHYEILGVTADGKYESYTETQKPVLYLPLERDTANSATLLVRSRTDPAGTLTAIRRELAALDPNIALEQAMPLSTLIGMTIFPQRVAAVAMGAFGGTGLLLAAIGLYGVLAFRVAARTREIGIRMALGAEAASIIRMVMGSSLRLALVGAAIGLLAAFGATRLLASLLYGITPTDSVTFAGAPILLLIVTLIATYVPARRAARVDPTIALKSE